MFTYSNSRRFWTMVSRMSFAVSIANYNGEFCSRIIAIPESYSRESAVWPTERPTRNAGRRRTSRNRSGSTAKFSL